jgi:hypothetical protein
MWDLHNVAELELFADDNAHRIELWGEVLPEHANADCCVGSGGTLGTFSCPISCLSTGATAATACP